MELRVLEVVVFLVVVERGFGWWKKLRKAKHLPLAKADEINQKVIH